MINVTQTFLPPLEELNAFLREIWDSKWLTNRGKLVRELEEKLKTYLGLDNILIVNNGTIALQIAIKTLDLKGEIITTPFSYVATASSIVWENCQPVFVDIDKDYLTIDENKIEDAITKNTSAIMATHVFGNPCNVEALNSIAEKFNLKIIYDAAHCFGVKYKNESVLNWGDISTLSFHATKIFHTGEGGAIVCHNQEIADKAYYHHNFGHRGEEDFWGLGINGKISEINIAVGLSLLPYMDEVIAKRKILCETYDRLFENTTIKKLKLREETGWNYSYYPVIFPTEEILLKVKGALNREEIFPRRYFYPSLNRLPYINYKAISIAEEISRTILCLPLYFELSECNIEKIAGIIKNNGVVA